MHMSTQTAAVILRAPSCSYWDWCARSQLRRWRTAKPLVDEEIDRNLHLPPRDSSSHATHWGRSALASSLRERLAPGTLSRGPGPSRPPALAANRGLRMRY